MFSVLRCQRSISLLFKFTSTNLIDLRIILIHRNSFNPIYINLHSTSIFYTTSIPKGTFTKIACFPSNLLLERNMSKTYSVFFGLYKWTVYLKKEVANLPLSCHSCNEELRFICVGASICHRKKFCIAKY